MLWTYEKVKNLVEGCEAKAFHFSSLASTSFIPGIDGDYHLTYHGTILVTYHPDNTFTLNSSGYRTRTTKSRLSEFGPVKVCSKGSTWYLASNTKEFIEFEDGMRVDTYGCPVQEEPDQHAPEMTVDNQINKGEWFKGGQ